jgi:hypothetical protein
MTDKVFNRDRQMEKIPQQRLQTLGVMRLARQPTRVMEFGQIRRRVSPPQ